MKKRLSNVARWGVAGVFAVASVCVLSAGSAEAADQERTEQQMQSQTQEQIYGSQLMTEQERAEYRAKMRAAKTAEEQEKIRKEHHEQMTARAAERGMTLPDEPPMKGGGMGMGPAPGHGGGKP
ncbi:MAG: hypothetical protein ACOYXU_04375 [Nitrospirota bacterium]